MICNSRILSMAWDQVCLALCCSLGGNASRLNLPYFADLALALACILTVSSWACAGLFFIGYMVLQIPSTYLCARQASPFSATTRMHAYVTG